MGKKDEHLPSGSTILWSRPCSDPQRVWVRCGVCGQERTALRSYTRSKRFTGRCKQCGMTAQRKQIRDATLPNGSTIFWTRRFRNEEGVRQVPVRCGYCGEERLMTTAMARHKTFTGQCPRCAGIAKRVHTTDETLPTGSVILWSRCFKDERGIRRVWVRCGDCGQERPVRVPQIYKQDFWGRCASCTQVARRKFVKSGTETLPSGSVIYWDDETEKNGMRAVLVRCGGPRCEGHTRYVYLKSVLSDNYTGFCLKCAQYTANGGKVGPENRAWKGGRRITNSGYVLVWLPPDHPLHGMVTAHGCVLEHRLVKAQQIGRPLRDDELVHHEDRNRQNNHPSNLRLFVKDLTYSGKTPHPGCRPVEPKPSPNRFVAGVNRLLWYLGHRGQS